MHEDTVTVVVATYGRPEVLTCALDSVLLQTHDHWRVLIIGDHCDGDVEAALLPYLQDPRFQYINLPFRCGEQALPNTAGIAAATTKWVALLNHDDVWLPWHLQHALRELKAQDAEFLIARSAWSWGEMIEGRSTPLLAGVSPGIQDWQLVFESGLHLVEPASSWVFQRALLEKVGHWRRSMDLYRAPIQDWCLRAWRAGVKMISGEHITCIKFENQWGSEAPERRYDTPATAQSLWRARLSDRDGWPEVADEVAQLAADPEAVGRGLILSGVGPAMPQLAKIGKALLTPHFAGIYYRTGLDSYSWLCAEARLPLGWRWRSALSRRTAEQNLVPPKLDEVLAFVQRQVAPWEHD